MSQSSYQQIQFTKRPLESAQSRLALLSYLTEKKDSAIYKKKSFFWDQEHLYSQNLTLRSQIKQLTEANIKAKTRILEIEAQIKSKEIKDHELGFKESVLRSSSLKTLSRKSLIVPHPRIEQQGRTKTIRQIVRQLRDQIASLKNENTSLKHSLKYTRMNELQASNVQMEVEMQRLANLTNQTRNKYYALAMEYEALKAAMKRQTDAKRIAIAEKSKIQHQLQLLQKEKQQIQKKKQMQERHLRQQIKKAKMNNPEIISTKVKLPFQENSSMPKLQYSISGLDRLQADTINFDKLLNSQSDLKSMPKLNSLVSLELQMQKQSTRNEFSPILPRAVPNSKMESHPQENYQEDYQFEPEDAQPKKEEKEILKQSQMLVDNSFEEEENPDKLTHSSKAQRNHNNQNEIKSNDEILPVMPPQKSKPSKVQLSLPSKQPNQQIQQFQVELVEEEAKEDSVYQDLFQEIQ